LAPIRVATTTPFLSVAQAFLPVPTYQRISTTILASNRRFVLSPFRPADSPNTTPMPPCHRLYYNLSMRANMLPALWRSSAVTSRALWRIARQVFHEFAGAMFIVFAVYGVLAAWRQWKTRPVLWLIGFAIVYALMMTIFGLVSFRRARRVR
jgi:hypothetical protein